jgi:hypothetical protein
MGIEFIGEWDLSSIGKGLLSVYADDYMPTDHLYIIASRTGGKLGVVSPHPASTLTVIDFTVHDTE